MRLWTPVAGISSVFVVPQPVQVKVLTPAATQVALMVTMPPSQVWLCWVSPTSSAQTGSASVPSSKTVSARQIHFFINILLPLFQQSAVLKSV